MNTRWKLKVAFVVLLAVLATLYLIPTLVRDRIVKQVNQLDENNQPILVAGKPVLKEVVEEKDNLPKWYPKAFRKYIVLGLDLQGGVLLQYGVDIYQGMKNKVDVERENISNALQDALKTAGKEAKVKVVASAKDELQLVVSTEPADALGAVGTSFLDRFFVQDPQSGAAIPYWKSSSSDAGLVLELSPRYREFLESDAVEQGKKTIENRIDKLAVKEPEIRKGASDSIVIQLPGLSEADFGQTQQIIEQTAQLQFKLVDDDNTAFLTTLRAAVKAPVEAYSEPVGNGAPSVYFRAEKREDLLAFLEDASGFGREGRRPDGSTYYKTLTEYRAALTAAVGAEDVRFGNARRDVLKVRFKAPTDPQVLRGALSAFLDANQESLAAKLTAESFVIKTEDGQPATGSAEVFLVSKSLRLPEDHELLVGEEVVTDAQGNAKEQFWRSYWLFRKTEITGDYLTEANVRIDPQDRRPVVSFAMNSRGGELLAKLSKENINKRFAIVLDNQVKSAPAFRSEIPNGQGQITLGSTKSPQAMMKEAQGLSIVLQAGALPAPLSRQFVTQIGPQLGKDGIDSGFFAAGVGAALIFLFMVVYYKKAGLIADAALALNILFLLAIMAALGATLTLPGIAGIVLTIGTAVDSNILIFERIREELRAGKSARQAIDAGYSNAMRAILDANATNLISALVLSWYGSGPVKGFAVTLMIGLVTSVFTSTFVTRLFFERAAQRQNLELSI